MENDCNPAFDDKFDFMVCPTQHNVLGIEIFDHDDEVDGLSKEPDFLGGHFRVVPRAV